MKLFTSLILYLLSLGTHTQNESPQDAPEVAAPHGIVQEHATTPTGLEQLADKMKLTQNSYELEGYTPCILDAFKSAQPSRRRLANTLVWQEGNQVLYKAGPEFQVNTYTASLQDYCRVASLSTGGFVTTWITWGQDGSGYGVYGQLFHTMPSISSVLNQKKTGLILEKKDHGRHAPSAVVTKKPKQSINQTGEKDVKEEEESNESMYGQLPMEDLDLISEGKEEGPQVGTQYRFQEKNNLTVSLKNKTVLGNV